MFRAILSGKGRAIDIDVRPGDTWRSLFRRSEDLLSAVVLTRLSYLDDALAWQLLQTTFKPELLPRSDHAKIERFELWPHLIASEKLGQDVEPDAIIEFSVSDPPERFILILEAKLDGFQTARQWALEWMAHEIDVDESGGPLKCFILALGGLPAGGLNIIASALASEANQIISKFGGAPVMQAMAADWSDLARSVIEANTKSSRNQRILKDMSDALALHGYRYTKPLSSLPGDAKHFINLSPAPFKAFKVWRDEARPISPSTTIDSAADWLDQTNAFRPIKTHDRTFRRWRTR